ncbi:hypothetical protein GCM10023165_52920 [Variovorax defluvii]|uniref:Uncharacterized protein n=1 Tax=Variovorax defluvii TaxID=913761 RepID=A0ABP8IGX4_9BURK
MYDIATTGCSGIAAPRRAAGAISPAIGRLIDTHDSDVLALLHKDKVWGAISVSAMATAETDAPGCRHSARIRALNSAL